MKINLNDNKLIIDKVPKTVIERKKVQNKVGELLSMVTINDLNPL